MPFVVVVDTSVSLPATLSAGGMMRRFWVVLALGALTYESVRTSASTLFSDARRAAEVPQMA